MARFLCFVIFIVVVYVVLFLCYNALCVCGFFLCAFVPTCFFLSEFSYLLMDFYTLVRSVRHTLMT
ncbi:hypothetical protein V1521DRAFT_89184 [Lipomyces starkeyi]